MSLYDGLDLENKDKNKGNPSSDVAGWSSSYKLLQSQLQAKKASTAPPKKGRSNARLAPVVDLKKTLESDYGLHFDQQTGKIQRVKRDSGIRANAPLPFISTPSGPSLTGAVDEYDPLHPNEYEEMVKLRRDEKERAIEEDRRREAEQDRRRRPERERPHDNYDDRDRHGRDHDDREMERLRRRRDEEEDDYERPRLGGHTAGAAIAPPPTLIEDDSEPANVNRSESVGGSAASVASKIMAKYGYKEGQGLGKSEQGMSIALQVEKTSKRGGKIIHERDLFKANADLQEQKQPNTNLLRNPSKVLLLLNMVGPGEVDEELEPETAEECSKYGKVIKCVIFEIPEAPDDESVRIFVEFERMEAAIKALVDLNGRYFGGRTVKGSFYNLDKFRRMDYSTEIE